MKKKQFINSDQNMQKYKRDATKDEEEEIAKMHAAFQDWDFKTKRVVVLPKPIKKEEELKQYFPDA